MQVIGVSLLTAYGERRPDAAPWLRGLCALLRAAHWKDRTDAEAHFPAIARFEDGGAVALHLKEAQLRVVLDINYGIGLVRVVSVAATDGAGR
jgi:mRNA-degrading endonuclease HigB of HigAB toxin-antitoxin module